MVHILWNKDEFHTVLLSSISVTHDQPCYENLKWKVPEVNNSTVLNCVLFWGAWWNFTPHCSNCLRTWSIHLFSVFTLHMPPTCQSLSDHISYQVDFSSVSQYLYKMFGTFWIFGVHQRSWERFIVVEKVPNMDSACLVPIQGASQ